MRAVERTRGFTLIEVIVALIVVSLGMLGVIQAVSQTASNSGYLRDKSVAHWIAMNRLTEVRLQRTSPPVDKSSDEVEMAGQRWKWTMNVTQTPVETIRRIDISVRPAEARENVSLASVSGFYGTAIAPPGTTLIAWQGAGPGGPQQDQQQPGENPGETPGPTDDNDTPALPPGEEIPTQEDDDPIDPSDPNQ
ncbi:MAG TPA: type II secretion system minor pseudopilin GspI [Steroidobacteraceae bacterium]|nr:type II secretion system minor pseudopilin GspI [Steroidobacteraceae bacterium]